MFERFTDAARRVLTLAQEEARRLDHSHLGTEHLLLGLLASGEGAGPQALTGLGITLEDARERVLRRVESTAPAVGSPPFTTRAKKVLELSLREALGLGNDFIGTEHLVLGIVKEGEGVGAQVLIDMTGDLDRVRQEVLSRLGKGAVGAKLSAPRRARLWASRSAPELGPAPRCGHCNAPLATEARYRALALPPGDEVTTEDRLGVTVVYCGRCGNAFGATPG